MYISRRSRCLDPGPPVLPRLRVADREVLQEEEAEVLARRDGNAADVQDAPGVSAVQLWRRLHPDFRLLQTHGPYMLLQLC